MEFNAIYEKVVFDRNLGFKNMGTNKEALGNARVNTLICPSSAVDAFFHERSYSDMDSDLSGGTYFHTGNSIPGGSQSGTEPHWPDGEVVQMHQYVGISGADPDPLGRTIKAKAMTDASLGTLSDSGTFTFNDAKSFAKLSDGTSNVIVVAEQSGMISQASGNKVPMCSTYGGGWSGCHFTGKFAAFPAGGDTNWACGLTCVRYPINLKTVVDGSNHIWNGNTILSSQHTGGINVLRGDGSCHFTSDSINMDLLRRLACADDGMAAE